MSGWHSRRTTRERKQSIETADGFRRFQRPWPTCPGCSRSIRCFATNRARPDAAAAIRPPDLRCPLDVSVSVRLLLAMAYQAAFVALADPTRRLVFEELRRGPQSVGKIAARMPVSRPAVSQHLAVLKKAGLVGDRAEGTRRVYYIDPQGLAAIRIWLDQFWDEALMAFQAEVEKEDASE